MGDLQQDKSDWEDDEKNRSIKAEDSGIFRRNAPVFLSDLRIYPEKQMMSRTGVAET